MLERVPIASVIVKNRRRQDLGDITSLAHNIKQHGLIHPITISDDGELIAGERRLRACESLQWSEIDARRWSGLSESERREIELAENLDRKDLTAEERSRQIVALAETAAEIDRREFRTESVRNGAGRPPEPGSLRRISERTGIPTNTLKTAHQHVAAIDTYPELTSYPQSDALKIATKLNAMPAPERVEARAAVLAHDSATLARLTDRPPVPNGATPQQRAMTDPAVRFLRDWHDLWSRINGVRDHGGIGVVISSWDTKAKAELLDSTQRIEEVMGEWQAIIKEGMR